MSHRALVGQRVVVTRAAHQADDLVAALDAAGAEVFRLPLIELAAAPESRELERAARQVADFDWLAFTSANAVHAFLSIVEPPLNARVAVVGAATAAALSAYGVEPAVESEKGRAECLVEDLARHLAPHQKALVPQAEDARPDLVRGLRAAGATVTAVVAYSKRLPAAAPAAAQRLFSTSPIGWVTCTSPRIVRHFAGLFGDDWARRRGEMKAVSIGPVTSAELRRLGVEPAAEATRPSSDGLVEAIVEAIRSRPGRFIRRPAES